MYDIMINNYMLCVGISRPITDVETAVDNRVPDVARTV